MQITHVEVTSVRIPLKLARHSFASEAEHDDVGLRPAEGITR